MITINLAMINCRPANTDKRERKMKIKDCPIFGTDSCIGENCKYFYPDSDKQTFCKHDEIRAFKKLAEGAKFRIAGVNTITS